MYPTFLAKIDTLVANFSNLDPGSQAIANDLLNEFEARMMTERGDLSPKQKALLASLADRSARIELPSFAPIIGMLEKAGGNTKIRLSLDGKPVQLALATKGSRPGTVVVTDGRPFANNTFHGRIDRDGKFDSRTEVTGLVKLLAKLATKPLETVGEYGHLTGSCSLCGRPLTNKKSVDMGVGPVCLHRFGF